MAIFNEILEGRYNRALQKLFAIKGSPPVRQIGGEIMPTFSIFHGVENRWLEGWQRYWTSVLNAAQAAVNSGVQIRNPIASNVVVVLEKVQLVVGLNLDDVTISIFHGGNTDLTNIFTGLTLDFRNLGQSPTLVLSANVGALADLALTPWTQRCSTSANDVVVDGDHQLTLLPGDVFRFRNLTVNSLLRVNLIWRERLMTESERQ